MGLRGEGIDRGQTLLGLCYMFFLPLFSVASLAESCSYWHCSDPLPLAQVKIKNQINQALIIMVSFF